MVGRWMDLDALHVGIGLGGRSARQLPEGVGELLGGHPSRQRPVEDVVFSIWLPLDARGHRPVGLGGADGFEDVLGVVARGDEVGGE